MAPAPKPTAKPGSKGGLGKKVGPLPVWAWGVLVLAVVAFFFLRSRSAAAGGGSGGDAGGPLATGGGSGGGGGASGDSGATSPDAIPVAVGVGDQKTEPGGEASSVGDGTTQSAAQTFQATNTSTPTSAFASFADAQSLPVAGVAANAPVYNVPSAPGSDALIQGPFSHPQELSQATKITPTGLALAVPSSPNYSTLNTPAGSNARRPGFQL